MARPGFIYVGAPKSGSTWLFEALRAHPGVWVVPGKSTSWFECEEPGPDAGYAERFRAAGPGQIAGEIAHDAWMYPRTAARLAAGFPQMRILACLREPGAFARSTLRWWLTHTTRYGATVAEMTAHPWFRASIDYPGRLAPFYDAFPAGQVRVVFQEDLKADASAFLREVLDFLGVDPDVRPAVLDEVVNPARTPRYPALTRTVYAVGGALRGLGLGGMVERAKRAPVLNRALYAADAAPAGADAGAEADIERAVAQVRAGMAPRLAALEAMIGRPVPAVWRSAAE